MPGLKRGVLRQGVFISHLRSCGPRGLSFYPRTILPTLLHLINCKHSVHSPPQAGSTFPQQKYLSDSRINFSMQQSDESLSDGEISDGSFFFFFFWLICIVWFCCSEYALPVNRDLIKTVPEKIQFYYNVKYMKLDTKLYKQCDLNLSQQRNDSGNGPEGNVPKC